MRATAAVSVWIWQLINVVKTSRVSGFTLELASGEEAFFHH